MTGPTAVGGVPACHLPSRRRTKAVCPGCPPRSRSAACTMWSPIPVTCPHVKRHSKVWKAVHEVHGSRASDIIKKGTFLYSIQSLRLLKALYTSPPGRHVHSNAISTSLGSIQPRCSYCAKTVRSDIHRCL